MEIPSQLVESVKAAALSNYRLTGESCPRCGEPLRVYLGDDKSEEDPDSGRVLEYRKGEEAPCWGCERNLDALIDRIEFLAHYAARLAWKNDAAKTDFEKAKVDDELKALMESQRVLNGDLARAGISIELAVNMAKEKYFRRRKRYG